jgi:hypothetical protein
MHGRRPHLGGLLTAQSQMADGSTMLYRWHWDGAATGLVAALSSIPHGKVDEDVTVLRAVRPALVTRGVNTSTSAWIPLLACCVDPIIILRGVHHTRRGHQHQVKDANKDTTIPGAWIVGRRRVPYRQIPWGSLNT